MHAPRQCLYITDREVVDAEVKYTINSVYRLREVKSHDGNQVPGCVCEI